MKMLTTEEIAQACGGAANGYAEITSVVIDNREVVPGCLFVAIKGERLDGHAFVQSAVEAGAAAVMVHEDIECDVPVIRVEDTHRALLSMAKYYRLTFGETIEEFPLIGLTGSVGKTTTKEMIWCVLNAKYNAHKTYMNWNNDIGLPRVLLGIEAEHTAAVIEMGMDAKGQISVLSRTALPNMAVITNIGVSHIENLGSREGILASKLEILEGLRAGSTLILNGDNDLLAALKTEDFDNKFKLTFFGIDNGDVRARDIVYTDEGTEFVLDFAVGEYNGKCKIWLPTTGEHNVYDALAAICVGLQLGIKAEDAAIALQNYAPAGMREKITELSGVTLIEDCYNASPDSVKALSQTIAIKGTSGKRKIAVIADMLELGDYSEEAHRNCGKYLADAGIDLLMTYGEKAKFVADSARENGIIRIFSFDDKNDLATKLISIMKPGDVIAFKGSRGMKLEEVTEKVREALKSL